MRKVHSAETTKQPNKKLNTYRFNSYNRLIVTAEPDSIKGSIDSIFKITESGKKLIQVDSTNYEFKKQMKRAHLFISEKNSEYTYTKNKGNRETVHATRTSGLKQPIYELTCHSITVIFILRKPIYRLWNELHQPYWKQSS